MAETSGFFNSKVDIDGIYDRVYLASDFADYFASLIGNGIFAGRLRELQILSSSGLTVLVQTGRAFINGYWYNNNQPIEITIPANASTSVHYHPIVIRLDYSQRIINVVLKDYLTSTGDIADSLIRDTTYYELLLGYVTISNSTTAITQANITDTRFNSSVCGTVKGLIEQIDTTEFATQLDAFIEETEAKVKALQDAINDDIQSITSDTPAMLKSVYDTNNDGVVNKADEVTKANVSIKLTDNVKDKTNVTAYICNDILYVYGKIELSSTLAGNITASKQSFINLIGIELPDGYSVSEKLFDGFVTSLGNDYVTNHQSKMLLKINSKGYIGRYPIFITDSYKQGVLCNYTVDGDYYPNNASITINLVIPLIKE